MKRGRFAPTPSGLLHIGNAFTALLAWLQIRQASGAFLLRIEDIDHTRSRSSHAKQMIGDLSWLGIDWDEGPGVGGGYGPYEQRMRTNLYEEAIAHLERFGQLYPCFCSRAELASIASAPHGLASEGEAYSGKCRSLTDAERALKRLAKHPSLRFAVSDRTISFGDAIQGRQQISAGALGDFVVKRADGMFSYQLAVAVDDAVMGVTDVVRGADLLDSTPRQLALYDSFGWNAPQYCHTPLLCAPDGSRLAKRDRSITIAGLREAGVHPEHVIGYFAYWAGLLDHPEPIKAAELVGHFQLNRIPNHNVAIRSEDLISFTGGN